MKEKMEQNPYMIYIPLSWEIHNDVPTATLWFSHISDEKHYFPYRGIAPTFPLSTKCIDVNYLPIDTEKESLICIMLMSDLKEWENIIQISLCQESIDKVWLNTVEWISIHSILSYSWNKCKRILFPNWCIAQDNKSKMCKDLVKNIDSCDYLYDS